MVRKQVYLTEEQNQLLARRAEQAGRSQSALIREALDRFDSVQEREARSAVLRQTAGLWAERDDLPDWKALRFEPARRLEALHGG
jgi:hypothetical protein